jgi:hypothetical protein
VPPSQTGVNKRALWAGGCLLFACLVVAIATFLVQLDMKKGAERRPVNQDTSDYEFYYGESYFTQYDQDKKITMARLVSQGDGPWLWISETEGFEVNRNNAVENGNRIAQHVGIEPWPGIKTTITVNNDFKWHVSLATSENPENDGDAWIHSRVKDFPIAISLTKDGPRVSLPCTYDELRKAFGNPTKINNIPKLPGAAGV